MMAFKHTEPHLNGVKLINFQILSVGFSHTVSSQKPNHTKSQNHWSLESKYRYITAQ